MKLILEAIKALFRKVENSLSALHSNIAAQVGALAKSVNNAQSVADEALNLAEAAQATADGKQPDVILSARVSDDIAWVSESVNLVNGRIYVVVPTSSSTSNSATSRINIDSKMYYIKYGITKFGWVSESNSVGAKQAFVANAPLVLLYSASNKVFYEITRFAATYLEASTTQNHNNKVPEYYYGVSGLNLCSRYKYMRVKSSTEGSAKLFDIQVDDSGTITAVEVT